MKKFLKHLGISILIGSFVFLFIFILNWIENVDEGILRNMKKYVIINFSYAIPLYFVSAYAFQYVKKLAITKDWPIWKAILVAFPFVIVINVVFILLIQYGLTTIFYENSSGFWAINLWDRIQMPLYISLTIGAIFYLVNLAFHYQKDRRKESEQKTLEITQTHEALKSQIGPHFLFNSLNVLSGLVEENPAKAQDFIADLAEVYRYVLDQKDKDWVTIAEEIVFAKKYLWLMKSRFEKGLKVEIDSELVTSTQFIAPLTLQLLLENALKHNKISEAEPLEIRLEKKDGYLMVSNTFNPKKSLEKREGKGLQQIQKRYESIGQKVKIEQNQDIFQVKIPFITS